MLLRGRIMSIAGGPDKQNVTPIFGQPSWLSTRMPGERPGVAGGFVRPPLVITEKEIANLRLRLGIGEGDRDRFILRVDSAEDHDVELPRLLKPVANCGDARDNFAVRRAFGDREKKVGDAIGIGLFGWNRRRRSFCRRRKRSE